MQNWIRAQIGNIAGGGGSAARIKSQQLVEVDFGTSTALTLDTALSPAVDLASTVIVPQGLSVTAGSTLNYLCFGLELVSATVLRATRQAGANVASQLKMKAIIRQFYPRVVKSIQEVQVTFVASGSPLSATSAITSVNTAKSEVSVVGCTTQATLTCAGWYKFAFMAKFNSATEIQINRLSSSNAEDVVYVQVVEYY